MHYYLSKICFLCLNSNTELIDVHSSTDTFEQINYALPEITNELTETSLFICSTCQTSLNYFHSYKTMCLNNFERWLNYIGLMKENSVQDVKFCEFKIVLKKLQLHVKEDSDIEEENDIPHEDEEQWEVGEIRTEEEEEDDGPSSNSERMGLLELKKLYCEKCKKIFKLYISKQTDDSINGTPDVNCMFCNNILIEAPSVIMHMLKQKTIESKEITMDEIMKNKMKCRLLKVAKQKIIEANKNPFITFESVQKTIEPIEKTNVLLTCKPIEELVEKTNEPIQKTNGLLTCKPIEELLERTKKRETNEKPLITLNSLLKTSEPIQKTNELLTCKPIEELVEKTKKLETNEKSLIILESEPMKKTNELLTCQPVPETVEKTNENTFESIEETVEPIEEIIEDSTCSKVEKITNDNKRKYNLRVLRIVKKRKLETNEMAQSVHKTIEPIEKTKIQELLEKTKKHEINIGPYENQFLTFISTPRKPVKKTNKLQTYTPIKEIVDTKRLESNIETIESAKKRKTNELLTYKPREELVEKTKNHESNIETNENQFIIFENAQETIEPMEKTNELLICKPIQELVEKTKKIESNIKTNENQFIIFENAQETIEPMEKTNELLTCKPIQELLEKTKNLESNIETFEPVAKTNELLTCKPIEELLEKTKKHETNEKPLITLESLFETTEPIKKTNELLTCKPVEELVEKTKKLETNEIAFITLESAQKIIEPTEETNELLTCESVPEIVEKTNEYINQIQNSNLICNNETDINNFTKNMRVRLCEKLLESNKLKSSIEINPLPTCENINSPEKAEQQLQTFIPKRDFHDNSQLLNYMSLSDNKLSGQCKICYKTFPTIPLETFERHIKRHIRNGKYQCIKCKKPFIFKINLEKHMKLYHKSDGFSCNLCDRVFATNVAKIQHMLAHRDETVAQNVVN